MITGDVGDKAWIMSLSVGLQGPVTVRGISSDGREVKVESDSGSSYEISYFSCAPDKAVTIERVDNDGMQCLKITVKPYQWKGGRVGGAQCIDTVISYELDR
jgi:hypothetical protein